MISAFFKSSLKWGSEERSIVFEAIRLTSYSISKRWLAPRSMILPMMAILRAVSSLSFEPSFFYSFVRVDHSQVFFNDGLYCQREHRRVKISINSIDRFADFFDYLKLKFLVFLIEEPGCIVCLIYNTGNTSWIKKHGLHFYLIIY